MTDTASTSGSTSSATTTGSTVPSTTFASIACDGFYLYAVMSDGTLWYRQRAGFSGNATWTQMTGPVESAA